MVKVLDKQFEIYISAERITEAIQKMADKINEDYKTEKPIFLAILNGSFIFAADILKRINIECEIEFLKAASYQNLESTGKVIELIGLSRAIKNRKIIILEDIIDTGLTMSKILEQLLHLQPASIEVVTLLQKPDALQKEIEIYLCGFEIENRFVVGYGLDYNNFGRNLPAIYIHI